MARSLVIQLARFGDLVQTKRLILSLLAKGDEVHLLVDRSLVSLARLVQPVAHVHAIAAHGVRVPDWSAVLPDLRRAFASLKDAGFTRVYNLNYSGLNFAVASLFDPATVRGYRYSSGQHHRDRWPELAMRWSRHRRETGLNLVDFWGAYCEGMVAPGEVNPPAVPKGGGLGVVLAGRHSRRSLPPDMLALVVQALFERLGGRNVYLLGSAAEKPAARALTRALKPRVLDRARDLAGQTDWAGLADVVSGLDAVVTPDTGTMHLAAHLGTPVVALFLSSAWTFETGPYGIGHTVWQASAPCAPCLESQPCSRDSQECLSPFGSPAFLRLLAGAGREGDACPGLTGYHSALDAAGVTYERFSGEDECEGQRRAFRSLIAASLGQDAGRDASELAARLFQERDWLLGKDDEASAFWEDK